MILYHYNVIVMSLQYIYLNRSHNLLPTIKVTGAVVIYFQRMHTCRFKIVLLVIFDIIVLMQIPCGLDEQMCFGS